MSALMMKSSIAALSSWAEPDPVIVTVRTEISAGVASASVLSSSLPHADADNTSVANEAARTRRSIGFVGSRTIAESVRR